jgi:hypothetical protein
MNECAESNPEIQHRHLVSLVGAAAAGKLGEAPAQAFVSRKIDDKAAFKELVDSLGVARWPVPLGKSESPLLEADGVLA